MERTKSIAMKAQARRHHLFLQEQKSFFAHRKTKKKDRFHLIPSNSGVEDSTLTHDPHSAPPSPAEGDALWWCLLDSTGTCRSLLLPIPLCGNRVLSSPHHRPLVRVAVHTLSLRIEEVISCPTTHRSPSSLSVRHLRTQFGNACLGVDGSFRRHAPHLFCNDATRSNRFSK